MKPARWDLVKSILVEALDLPPRDRRAHVERVAGGDDRLTHAVMRLLDRESDRRLRGSDPLRLQAGGTAPLELVPGERVGPFTVLHRLGRGASSRVYAARQDEPSRRVALKVLASGRPTPEARWRFRHEARVLGGLRHPGIATVLHAGEETRGDAVWCWFAMELVRPARDLSSFARPLARRERLRAFRHVCEAVQHGHRHGVLHRDLKPENILVGDDDRPRIIDFGVARVVGPSPADGGVTRRGQFVGTLSYSSPEQLSGDPARVDTRTDIYALGVILFELLTDELPHDLGGLSFAEVIRAVREKPPATRALERRNVPCDLRAIVLRALAKEPEDRYSTAEALAADVGRYLDGYPVTARRPGPVRRAYLFGRRHARVVVAAAVALVALAGGFVWHARVRAEAEQEIAARDAYGAGFRDVVQQMIGLANPRNTGSDVVAGEDILETAAAVADERLRHIPQALIETHSSIATAYQGALEHERALHHWRRAADTARVGSGLPADYRLRARFGLVTALLNVGRVEEGIRELETGLAEARARGLHRIEAMFLHGLASASYRERDFERARGACDGALALMAREPHHHEEYHADCVLIDAYLHNEAGDRDRCEASLRRAIDIQKHARRTRPAMDALLQLKLARFLHDRDATEAEKHYRAALPFYRASGRTSHATVNAFAGLGEVLRRQERFAEAEPFLRRAVVLVQRDVGTRHPQAAAILRSFVAVLRKLDRFLEAEPFLEHGAKTLKGPERTRALQAFREILRRKEAGAEQP